MTVRVYAIVEGDTEERFFNMVLVRHLANLGIFAQASRVVTQGRRGSHLAQGGGRSYGKWRDDLMAWIRQQGRHSNVWFTTMLDLYGLARFTDEFPGFEKVRGRTDPVLTVRELEQAWSRDIDHPHFIPYLQLHEFEALLLVDVSSLKPIFVEHTASLNELAAEIRETRKTPEQIDDGDETHPSRRIIRRIRQYEFQKASAGPQAANRIGLSSLRRACPHFDAWVKRLESLSGV